MSEARVIIETLGMLSEPADHRSPVAVAVAAVYGSQTRACDSRPFDRDVVLPREVRTRKGSDKVQRVDQGQRGVWYVGILQGRTCCVH